MNLPFTKMQGLGNDFVVLNAADLHEFGGVEALSQWQELAPIWAKTLCDRHFGIGADGLIVLFDLLQKKTYKVPDFITRYPGGDAQYAWTYTNSDGSWSQMCGNGLRCAALYLQDRGLIDKQSFSLSTGAGVVPVRFGDKHLIETDFGVPLIEGALIPSTWKSSRCVRVRLEITCFGEQHELAVTGVNVGNPHCVIFEDVLGNGKMIIDRSDRESLEKIARFIQASPVFPEGVNVDFAWAGSRDKVRLDVFERGCGWTLACGSAAAATLVAGVLEERLLREAEIMLPGGAAFASWDEQDNHVRLLGPAREVFSGYLEISTMADGALIANLREVVS